MSSNESNSTFNWVDVIELVLILFSIIDFILILVLFKDYRWSIADGFMIFLIILFYILDVVIHDSSS